MDGDSLQHECGKLVEREVYHCVSTLMSMVMRAVSEGCQAFDVGIDETINWSGSEDYKEPLAYYLSDFDNYSEDVQTQTLSDLQSYDVSTFPEFSVEQIMEELDESGQLQDICEEWQLEPTRSEVYEYWAVSDWLGEKLKEEGEIVFDFADFTVWGRTCSGQAILLDGVIERIFRKLHGV